MCSDDDVYFDGLCLGQLLIWYLLRGETQLKKDPFRWNLHAQREKYIRTEVDQPDALPLPNIPFNGQFDSFFCEVRCSFDKRNIIRDSRLLLAYFAPSQFGKDAILKD